MRRRAVAGLLFLSLSSASARDVSHWTPRQARAACESLVSLAVRRAEVTQVVYTRPARYRRGAWTLKGWLRLARAPGEQKRAPFVCTFTRDSDHLSVQPVSLVMGP